MIPQLHSHTLHFDSTGKPSEDVQGISKIISYQKITDLIVISHGWKNNEADADELYSGLVKQIENVLNATPLENNRRFGILKVYWPSKWLDTAPKHSPSGGGGAASSTSLNPSDQEVTELFDQLADFFKEDESEKQILQNIRAVISKVKSNDEVAIRFLELLKQLSPNTMTVPVDPMDDLLNKINPNEGNELLERFQVIPIDQPDYDSGNAASIGAAIGEFFDSALEKGPYWLLNSFTYKRMRERANLTGQQGLNPALRELKEGNSDLKLHLVGHSFGALLVTAAVLGPDEQPRIEIDTLTLLQAAFSHYSFAQKYQGVLDGVFRPVLKQVKGPVLISHTHRDKAVKNLYAFASSLKNQVASNVGDEDCLYGGLGSNGAQITPETSDEFRLSWGITDFDFKPKKVYNLNADALITDHSDICHKEVAHAILSAIATT